MRLTILGMNGPYPAPGSNCSGYLIDNGSERIMFDLGTGTLSALTALTAPEELTALVFSHWHHDHSSDLLPLLYRLADAKGRGCAPLKVYGPEDPSAATFNAARNTPCIELHILQPDDEVMLGGCKLHSFAARHPVPALMYRMTDGETVFAFTGDTNTTEALPALADHADLLLADGLFTRQTWAEGKPHLSASMCAELARDAQAKQLVITHLHPDLPAPVLLSEAREAYIKAKLARCGDTYTF